MMKNEKEINVLVTARRYLALIILIATPIISYLVRLEAVAQRGTDNLGGEICVPILMVIISFLVYPSNRNCRDEFSDMTRLSHNHVDIDFREIKDNKCHLISENGIFDVIDPRNNEHHVIKLSYNEDFRRRGEV